MLKRCSKCGFEKDIRDFYRKKTTKDGYRCWCKGCFAEYHKEYNKKNKGRIIECHKDYYKKHKDKLNERQKEYHKENKNQKMEYDKKYRKDNKNKIAKYHKEYYKNNKDRRTECNREYAQTPNGKMAMTRARHKRRALMKDAEATLTTDQWQRVISMQGDKCNRCKQKFTNKRPPTVDHIIPVSKGGSLTFENAQALCKSCNSSKHDKLDLGVIQTWSHEQ